MKKILFVLSFVCVLPSCITTFYQLHEIKAISDDISNELIYQDDNCEIFYDFWSDKGNSGFTLYNKSDKNLFVDKNSCFFIKNEISYDYFRNRTFSYSKSIGSSNNASKAVVGINNSGYIQQNKLNTGISSSTGKSVSYLEKNIECIPPKTQKSFYEYSISSKPFRLCDIKKFPVNSRSVTSANFNTYDSPVTFANVIVYKLEGNETQTIIKNEFYVDKITNYPSSMFKSSKKNVVCKSISYDDVYNYEAKGNYFIKYTSQKYSWDYSMIK